MCDECIAARVRPHASACRTSPSRRGSTCISLGTRSKSRCAPRGRGWSRGPEERARARRAGQPAPEPNPSPNPHPNPTQDLTTDFGDGIKLIKLVENISEETLGKYHKSPGSKIQKIENINLPIKYINSFVASIGIKNTYSAENIIDQDKQFILGMVRCTTPPLPAPRPCPPAHPPAPSPAPSPALLPAHPLTRPVPLRPFPCPVPSPTLQVWTLILRFSINECSEGDMTAKEGLLQWAKKKVAAAR